jgi:hypothetical protein
MIHTQVLLVVVLPTCLFSIAMQALPSSPASGLITIPIQLSSYVSSLVEGGGKLNNKRPKNYHLKLHAGARAPTAQQISLTGSRSTT